eukprot:68585_1
MKKINKELNDHDIDELLDEIETQNEFIHNREQTASALKPRNIKKEWMKVSQKHRPQFTAATDHPQSPPHTSPHQHFNSFPQPPVNDGFVNNNGNNHRQIYSSSNVRNNKKQQQSQIKEAVIFEETCSYFIGECVNIERIIFILKYYKLWREYKMTQNS